MLSNFKNRRGILFLFNRKCYFWDTARSKYKENEHLKIKMQHYTMIFLLNILHDDSIIKKNNDSCSYLGFEINIENIYI